MRRLFFLLSFFLATLQLNASENPTNELATNKFFKRQREKSEVSYGTDWQHTFHFCHGLSMRRSPDGFTFSSSGNQDEIIKLQTYQDLAWGVGADKKPTRDRKMARYIHSRRPFSPLILNTRMTFLQVKKAIKESMLYQRIYFFMRTAYKDGFHYIQATVKNGEAIYTGQFLLDTGANTISIKDEGLKQLGISREGLKFDHKVSLAAGEEKSASARAKSLSFGDLEVLNPGITIMEKDASNIIGIAYLNAGSFTQSNWGVPYMEVCIPAKETKPF